MAACFCPRKMGEWVLATGKGCRTLQSLQESFISDGPVDSTVPNKCSKDLELRRLFSKLDQSQHTGIELSRALLPAVTKLDLIERVS